MINQLFASQPDQELIQKCLNILGWRGLHDKRVLLRCELPESVVCALFNDLIPELSYYYLPCKQRFLDCSSIKAVITITRQLLKTIGWNITGTEKISQNKKTMLYRLVAIDDNKGLPIKPATPVMPSPSTFIISWD